MRRRNLVSAATHSIISSIQGMNNLLDLFFTFMRIGGLTFGGGYAMLPVLQREVVEKRGWATNEELMDYYAIGQCTPGVIAINTATFVGNKRGGVPGAVAATLGFVFPSLVIISIIAAFISNFADYPIVRHAFAGIRVCVFILILNATVRLSRASIKDSFTLFVFLLVLAGSTLIHVSPVIFIVAAGIAGIVAKVLLHINEEEAAR